MGIFDTKTIRFNLYGNSILKNEKPRIILEDASMCLEDFKSDEEEIEQEEYYYEHPSTLRDISILLDIACGQGVMWQLSRELSKELNIDKKDIQIALEKIITKYSEMEEDDASKLYLSSNLYIKTSDDMPDEAE